MVCFVASRTWISFSQFVLTQLFSNRRGAMYAGSIGVGLALLILVAHFDTVCLPKLWMHVFRDASTIERNIILCLLVFWATALHVCTSSLSIGEVRYHSCGGEAAAARGMTRQIRQHLVCLYYGFGYGSESSFTCCCSLVFVFIACLLKT